jgi:hypothetical protein
MYGSYILLRYVAYKLKEWFYIQIWHNVDISFKHKLLPNLPVIIEYNSRWYKTNSQVRFVIECLRKCIRYKREE